MSEQVWGATEGASLCVCLSLTRQRRLKDGRGKPPRASRTRAWPRSSPPGLLVVWTLK